MRVTVGIQECDLEGEDGRDIPGICARCGRCGDEVTVFGTSDRSVKRAMIMLREGCSREETNFYVPDDGGAESRMPDPVVRPWWQK